MDGEQDGNTFKKVEKAQTAEAKAGLGSNYPRAEGNKPPKSRSGNSNRILTHRAARSTSYKSYELSPVALVLLAPRSCTVHIEEDCPTWKLGGYFQSQSFCQVLS